MIDFAVDLLINQSSNQSGFYLDRQIKVGDIITVLAIFYSLVSLLSALEKERKLRRKEQADNVRSAAAKTIAKLDRWKELSLSMFTYMDVVFVNTSKLWNETANKDLTRDTLWEDMNIIRGKNSEKILSEDIGTAYMDIYGYDPSVRPFFAFVLNQLKNEEEVMFQKGLLAGLQYIIESFDSPKNELGTASFRDPLMEHANNIRGKYETRLYYLLEPVASNLMHLIILHDEGILEIEKPYFEKLEIKFPPIDAEAYGVMTQEKFLMIRGNA